jgi:hypothetical protein
MNEFNLGDRVMLRDSSPDTKSLFNGIVVKYQGKHNKKESRVRWHSGWATSVANNLLRKMTEQEETEFPLPVIFEIDK